MSGQQPIRCGATREPGTRLTLLGAEIPCDRLEGHGGQHRAVVEGMTGPLRADVWIQWGMSTRKAILRTPTALQTPVPPAPEVVASGCCPDPGGPIAGCGHCPHWHAGDPPCCWCETRQHPTAPKETP